MWKIISTYVANRAVNTQLCYAGAVKDWCRYLEIEPYSAEGWPRFINANPHDAEGYISDLSGREGIRNKLGGSNQIATATIRNRLILLRRIYQLYIACGHLRINPFALVDMRFLKKSRKRQADIVPFERVKDLVYAPYGDIADGIRDRAFLALLFGAGLRISEAQKLTLDDIRVSAGGLLYLRLIETKTEGLASQSIPAWGADLVAKLVARRKAEGANERDPLLVRYRGSSRKPLSGKVPLRTLFNWFVGWRDRLGLTEMISSHSGRVTSISKLLSDGHQHREVQKFSRHSDVRMVEVYDRNRVGIEKNIGNILDY